MDLARRSAAEFVGTAFLVTAVVGSGIMGERLAGGNIAIALLANTLATGAALFALISAFQSISGAHFNPVVTIADALLGGVDLWAAALVVAAQMAGAVTGTLAAHVMFGLAPLQIATHPRGGVAQAISEVIATFGLLVIIRFVATNRPGAVAAAVGAYITAAYWFTASTSFANPAVTVARSLTDTFSGIRPADVPVFVVAQLAGAASAIVFARWLLAPTAAKVQE